MCFERFIFKYLTIKVIEVPQADMTSKSQETKKNFIT